jgi:2-Cys peroxiredoxin 5
MLSRLSARSFSTSARRLFQYGDSIPSISTLREGSPGNAVDLATETKEGKSIIVGVPGAFSPACSASHVPGYINNLDAFKAKGYKVFVTGVNDSFVFKAWADQLLNGKEVEGIRFIADPSADFAQAGELAIDATPFFGGIRGKRYAIIVENGRVVKEISEPDNFGVDVSSAEKVLADL